MKEQLVILSPCLTEANGTFPDWGVNGTYIGGDIRMRAGAQLVSEHPNTECFLIGGMDTDEFALSHPSSAKTWQMGHYISERTESETWRRLIDVPSLPCTYHNFVALFGLMKAIGRLDQPGSIALTILTNCYHISRSQVQAGRAWNDVILPNFDDEVQADVTLQWFGAEEVLGIPQGEIRAKNPAYYDERIRRERQGLAELKAGIYSDSCLRHKEALRRNLIIGEYLNRGVPLLAPHEKDIWRVQAPL